MNPDGPARLSAVLTAGLGLATAVVAGTSPTTVGAGLLATGVLVWGSLRPLRPVVLLGTAGLFAPILYGLMAGIEPFTAVVGATTGALAYDAASRTGALRRRVAAGVDTRDAELVGLGGALCVAAVAAPVVYGLSVSVAGLPADAAAAALLVGLVVAAWLLRDG